MKSQNQLKYFLNTNVGTYGITKDNIATCVVAQYDCIKYLNFLVFQDQIVFTYPPPTPKNLWNSTSTTSIPSIALAR